MVAAVGDGEVERIVQLMDDLARPFFVLRAAQGLLAAAAIPNSVPDIGRRRGAAARRDQAIADVKRIIDQFEREAGSGQPRKTPGVQG